MASSSQRVVAGSVDPSVSTNNAHSKLKTYGFVIAIIVGLGGIGVGITGVVGFFHVGALSNLTQVNAIIMMAAGGGGGIVFLIIGIVGTVKNHQKDSPRQPAEITTGQPSPIITNEEKPRFVDTKGGLVYGADAYKAWNMEVVEAVPEAPPIDWKANDPYFNQPYSKNFVQLYFAEKVRVNGEEKVREFNLQTMQEVSKGSFSCLSKDIPIQFNKPISPGWRLISKKMIPNSRSKNFETQQKLAEEQKGFRMLHVLEAMVLNLVVFRITGERLYGTKPLTLARCFNKVDGKYPVVVGGFGSVGLDVCWAEGFVIEACGVAVIREL